VLRTGVVNILRTIVERMIGTSRLRAGLCSLRSGRYGTLRHGV